VCHHNGRKGSAPDVKRITLDDEPWGSVFVVHSRSIHQLATNNSINMGMFQQSPRAAPVSQTSVERRQGIHWPLFASSAWLCALSTIIFSLISSMVAWLLDQKHHVHAYQVDWPGNPTELNVEPKNLWTDQGHESNGLAVYGFFLGVFGMLTAWRMRKTGQVWQMKSYPSTCTAY
jgi:hypothetical protein